MRRPAAVAILALMMTSGLVWRTSEASFSRVTANGANSWATGQVSITDDDGGSIMFTVTGLKPGFTDSRCIRVSYGGSVGPGPVRIYATAPTGTLGTDLLMTVEVGTVGSFAGGCGAFSATSTVFTDVPLSTIGTKTTYAAGYPTGWSPTGAESRVFRFTYTLSKATPDDQQGASCAIPFTWETQT